MTRYREWGAAQNREVYLNAPRRQKEQWHATASGICRGTVGGDHRGCQRNRPCRGKAVRGIRHENLPRRSEPGGARPSRRTAFGRERSHGADRCQQDGGGAASNRLRKKSVGGASSPIRRLLPLRN